MLEVTKKEFFDAIGKMDVSPVPQGKAYNNGRYDVAWKTRTGLIVGLTKPKDEKKIYRRQHEILSAVREEP